MGSYTNAWQGWEAQVLAAARLPNTPQNQTFLANWHATELSNANYNPLNTTAYAPIPVTVGRPLPGNSSNVQIYSSAQQGAAATAAFLKMPNYSQIFAGLKSGDPYGYAAKSQSTAATIAQQLAKWGSHAFALKFLYENPTSPAAGTSVTQVTKNPDTGQTTTSTTQGPGFNLTGWVGQISSWLGAKGPYAAVYLMLVLFAAALGLIGLLRLAGVHSTTVIRTVGATA